MVAKRCELFMHFIEWPFNKNKNKPLRWIPDKKTVQMMYSNIGVSFHETFPLKGFSLRFSSSGFFMNRWALGYD